MAELSAGGAGHVAGAQAGCIVLIIVMMIFMDRLPGVLRRRLICGGGSGLPDLPVIRCEMEDSGRCVRFTGEERAF